MHTCVYVCESSKASVTAKEAKNRRCKSKSKALHNGTFSFDISNDILPSIRVTSSQFLNEEYIYKKSQGVYTKQLLEQYFILFNAITYTLWNTILTNSIKMLNLLYCD